MYITFDKPYLRELYETGHTADKKHRYQPEVVRSYVKCVRLLFGATKIEDLYKFNSLNYEMLSGDKAGISSVRINRKYRLEFTVGQFDGSQVVNVCNLLDISNHYK